MWGKGVSVDCGRWIAEWVKASLEGNPGTIRGDRMPDGDDWLIDASAWHKDAPRRGDRWEADGAQEFLADMGDDGVMPPMYQQASPQYPMAIVSSSVRRRTSILAGEPVRSGA
jgi:hypothetical protein